MTPGTRRLAAILSADVGGYSRLMAEDEAATIRTLGAHQEQIGVLVREQRGRVEAAARAAAQADDRDAAAVIVSDFMARNVEEALRQAERLRDQISG